MSNWTIVIVLLAPSVKLRLSGRQAYDLLDDQVNLLQDFGGLAACNFHWDCVCVLVLHIKVLVRTAIRLSIRDWFFVCSISG
jgi:hypothetical protein